MGETIFLVTSIIAIILALILPDFQIRRKLKSKHYQVLLRCPDDLEESVGFNLPEELEDFTSCFLLPASGGLSL